MLNPIPYLILSLFAVVDPNLYFFLFSLATGINCNGDMCMFGCGSISCPKFGITDRVFHKCICPPVLTISYELGQHQEKLPAKPKGEEREFSPSYPFQP